jgi:hypothetical protein
MTRLGSSTGYGDETCGVLLMVNHFPRVPMVLCQRAKCSPSLTMELRVQALTSGAKASRFGGPIHGACPRAAYQIPSGLRGWRQYEIQPTDENV